MKIQNIRYQNLLRLLDEVQGNQAELARRANTNPAYISQIVNGSPLPSGRPRAVGDGLARRLERAFYKDEGWMDTSESGSTQVGLIAEPSASYQVGSPMIERLVAAAKQLDSRELELLCRMVEGMAGNQPAA